jgi:hypothetical protein
MPLVGLREELCDTLRKHTQALLYDFFGAREGGSETVKAL